ncbi:hypothetical protein QR685DRAFT_538498 [Neurospora intermedia]|uniref:Secreted protein n=1 Tax=Neurospora intermedia TaxID=5142 RepID=A0ABR3CY41_NEUIN
MCLCVVDVVFSVTFCLRVLLPESLAPCVPLSEDPLGRALIQLRFTVCDKFGRGSPRGTELRVNVQLWMERYVCASKHIR